MTATVKKLEQIEMQIKSFLSWLSLSNADWMVNIIHVWNVSEFVGVLLKEPKMADYLHPLKIRIESPPISCKVNLRYDIKEWIWLPSFPVFNETQYCRLGCCCSFVGGSIFKWQLNFRLESLIEVNSQTIGQAHFSES